MQNALSKFEKIQIVSGAIESISNNICKLLKGPEIEQIIMQVMQSLIENDDEFKEKLHIILLNGVRSAVYDLNGNKVILAQLLKNKKNVMVDLVKRVFNEVLSKMDKVSSNMGNAEFFQTFISKLGKTMNTPSIIFKLSSIMQSSNQSSSKTHKGTRTFNRQYKGVRRMIKGGNENPTGGSIFSNLKQGVMNAFNTVKESAGATLKKSASGGLDASEKKTLVNSGLNAIGSGIVGLNNITSAITGKKTPTPSSSGQIQSSCPPLFPIFDYAAVSGELQTLLQKEIPDHKSLFADKIASGLEYSLAKSRGSLVDVMVRNMKSAYNDINASLGTQMSNILIYQLLLNEMDSFGEAVNTVITRKQEEFKNNRDGFDYREILMNDITIRDVCTSMEITIVKQLQQPHDAANSARVRIKMMGGGRRYTKKRIMPRPFIKRFTSRSIPRMM
jgi:hypothetical protein